ncbi:MAG: tRNA epoxyqueuosine(34) reductase QueG [Bacteroidales bacterium]
MDIKELTILVKEKSASLGFDMTGIARTRRLTLHEEKHKQWIDSGNNAGMGYLARNISGRYDPSSLLPEAKSIIVTAISYNTENDQEGEDVPVISRYARGEDYHDVIKPKLEKLLDLIRDYCPEVKSKICVDSSPIAEKAWAVEAGLGWRGRNSLVINDKLGSFFFIGLLLVDIDLGEDDQPVEDLCGSCSACIEGCPTGAINDNRTIDARRCISNLTIENRGPIPQELIPLLNRRVYGCDICQDVCPWNRKAIKPGHPFFRMSPSLENMTRHDWLDLSSDQFQTLFSKSPVGRVGYERFKANIAAVLKEN